MNPVNLLTENGVAKPVRKVIVNRTRSDVVLKLNSVKTKSVYILRPKDNSVKTPNVRPNLNKYWDSIKFKHPDFPEDEFEFMHPTVRTTNCDAIILPFNNNPDLQKQVAIPVDKSILEMIPYYQSQLNNTVGWREMKESRNGIVLLTTPEEVSAKSVFSYIESLYSSNQSFISKENCLDILCLSKFWCDEFVAIQAESFIEKNMDEEIYKTIRKNGELQALLEEVLDKFTASLFKQAADSKSKFTILQIQKRNKTIVNTMLTDLKLTEEEETKQSRNFMHSEYDFWKTQQHKPKFEKPAEINVDDPKQ